MVVCAYLGRIERIVREAVVHLIRSHHLDVQLPRGMIALAY